MQSGISTSHVAKHSLNSDKLPSSLGRAPVNELPAKLSVAVQKKEIDRRVTNERHPDTADLFLLLDAER
jgi:hypothetical protein